MSLALVSRVLFEGKRAVGVEFEQGGTLRRAAARREVILSAGTIGSPAILLRSGIGPSADLDKLGIPVLADLPVGRNLQDHPNTRVLWHTTSPLSGNGRCAPGCIGNAGGFANVNDGADRPTVQFISGWAVEKRSLWVTIVLLHPRSVGEVRLRSIKATDPPVIDPKYLSDARDRQDLIAGLRLARRFRESKALEHYLLEEVTPGGATVSDAQLSKFIEGDLQTTWHPVGTCRMGEGPEAVVNSELRVRGFERLRVVDASVMPTITSGNTNEPTIMIAERAADLIRGRSR